MARPWLRLWDKTLESYKAQSLPPEIFKNWINLLCLANRQEERGQLPEMKAIAFTLRISTKEASALIETLIESGLIDRNGDITSMHDWEYWQPESDSTAAERMRRSREQKKLRDAAASLALRNGCATGDETGRATSDATVTKPFSRPRAGSDSDTDTDSDAEKSPPPPKGGDRGFSPPEWIPRSDWNDYLAMRQKIRKPPTDRAKALVVAKLDRFRQAGFDPATILQESIRNSWQDVYEPKPVGSSPGISGILERPKTEAQLKRERIRAWARSEDDR